MAAAIYYAAAPISDQSAGCQVMSISAGGLPSAAWADAVNYAYDQGVSIVAATGDCFDGFPIRSTVWPARFERVIAVAGATAENRPYSGEFAADGSSLVTMQGNYGPPHTMRHAVAAWTPNIAWAHWAPAAGGTSQNVIDLDGAGTSAATPQVASACALYWGKYSSALNNFQEPWQRAEAVRQALFHSAAPPEENPYTEYLGHGLVKAARMLTSAPTAAPPVPPDSVDFESLRNLLDIDSTTSDSQALILETAQIIASSQALERTMRDLHLADWDAADMTRLGEGSFTDEQKRLFRQALRDSGRCSKHLLHALQA